MTVYDVIVAGAGPAGSTAARECASAGVSTLLLDRAEFPRDKPCGGGVNLRASRLLPFNLSAVAERPISGMRISIRQGASYLRYAPAPISYVTQRRLLDAFLAERAVAAGADFRERAEVRAVEQERGVITVRAGREAFAGRTLVAADGANGPTARLAGVRVERSKEIALEGNITPNCGYPEEWSDVFGIDVGAVPGGYGWLFPKGDHVNIGVGGLAAIGPTLRARLDRLVRFYGFDPKAFWGLRGHPLPVRRPGSPLAGGRVLLVGDAAGLLDPMSGEGIYAAIWSGRAAARRLAAFLSGRERDIDGYRLDIEREIEPDLITARQLHAIFHLAPHLWARFVRRSPRAWRLICGLATGEATYVGIKRRSPLVALAIDIAAGVVERASSDRPALAPRPS
jgi:geranylgeranyl reductase family protein